MYHNTINCLLRICSFLLLFFSCLNIKFSNIGCGVGFLAPLVTRPMQFWALQGENCPDRSPERKYFTVQTDLNFHSLLSTQFSGLGSISLSKEPTAGKSLLLSFMWPALD